MTPSREPDFVDQLTDDELLDIVGPEDTRPAHRSRSLRLVTPEEAQDARYEAAQGQVLDAVQTLELPASAFKRMPWPSLDAEFVGGIAPGKLWYWVMASNNGKTLLVRSFVEEKISVREKVFLLSTETTPHDFRLALACNELGIYPGDLLSGEYLTWDNHADIRQSVKRVMAEHTLYERQQYDLLQFPTNGGKLSAQRIWRAAEEAANQEAEWFIVDHVDYLDVPPGAAEISVSNAVNTAIDEVRKRFPFRVIATSQMNQKPFDRLGRLVMLTAPVEDWVKFGGVKKENADGMLGGYRPLQHPVPDDETMKSYKAGNIGIEEVAMPDAIRIKLLKHRDYGRNRVGRTATLEVYKGHVREFADRDKGFLHGIRTTGRPL